MDTMQTNMPAVALRGITILPGMIAHFDISREKSMNAIEVAMATNQRIYLITQNNIEVENPHKEDLYSIGVCAEIHQVMKMPNNIIRVLVEGYSRARLVSFTEKEEYLEANIEKIAELEDTLDEEVKAAMSKSIREVFMKYSKINKKLSDDTIRQVKRNKSLSQLIDYIANNIPITYDKKQLVLEAETLEERYEVLLSLLFSEINVTSIQQELQQKVRNRVDENQKRYILREQMDVIREELGEDEKHEIQCLKNQTDTLNASEEVKQHIYKEIHRLEALSSSSSESAVVRTYIETLLELPWETMTEDNTDILGAKAILDEDHYGLDKIKDRILDYLAVRNYTGKSSDSILCLVGPPGTGKTSIAQSIARALNKKYARICLGGVRDEAEIRGHRKTYVGAMAGRIIYALKQAQVKNPLILLDEIDKVSSDYKGDTASALLEVLDREQNRQFRDHYVELPVDLSEVLFIATANSLSNISKPLLDRMDIIELNSYTENEKLHIAKQYLIPKQMKENGLSKSQITITDAALERIIRYYTKEAGVRQLERKIGQICRKVVRRILENPETTKITISNKNLFDFLGKEKYKYLDKNKKDDIGIVRGLAWTSVGGVTLEIEVNILPGKGELKLTGQLGDVMKESAQAALSYIRSVAESYQIQKEFFQENDIHIHIPEGATPKDGPSAGITMATAMLSAITNSYVRADVAMTGEITIRGRVMSIGGLKEKLLAANKAGIKTVCIPKDNMPDLQEISEEITDALQIIPVEHIKEVIAVAFAKE